MGFIGALFGAHGKKAIQNVTEAVVALDPKTASEAQLAAMEADLRTAATKLAQFRVDAARERKEADDARVRHDRMLEAGKQMYAKMQAPDITPEQKAQLEQSLLGLRATILKLETELAREESEAKEAEAIVSECEQMVTEKGKAINEAKIALQTAMRDLDRAKLAESHAKERAERQAELAGLRDNDVGSLNTALKTLQKQTDQARVAAATHNTMRDQLTYVEPGSTDDPNVLAALAAVDHKGSGSDDLAALFGPTPTSSLQLEHKASS